jgi:beta-phosphoglucomutase-like phosphatase (HAD superfamily)
MDGLLIDSEDLYTDITNQVLHSFGKPSLPWSIKAQLQGRPQPEVRFNLLTTLQHLTCPTPTETQETGQSDLTEFSGCQNLLRLGTTPYQP